MFSPHTFRLKWTFLTLSLFHSSSLLFNSLRSLSSPKLSSGFGALSFGSSFSSHPCDLFQYWCCIFGCSQSFSVMETDEGPALASVSASVRQAGFSAKDGEVESGEGFAGDGHGGLEGGASSLQLAEAVDSLPWQHKSWWVRSKTAK